MRMTFRKLRRKSGLTLADLARAMKVHPSTVSLWESGHRTPHLSKLNKLSEVLGVPMVDVFQALNTAAPRKKTA